MAKYVVVADAVVVTIGKKLNGSPETARALRGEVITVTDETNEHLQALIDAGAVVKATSPEHATELKGLAHRLTARKAALAVGAEDPIQPPADTEPLDAPLPDTKPPTAKKTRAKAPADA